MRKTALLVSVVFALALVGFVGTAPAAAEDANLEGAEDDQGEASFTFTTESDTTEVTFSPTEETVSGVTFQFDRWEAVDGFESGTVPEITGDDINDTTYEVFYTVQTDAPVYSEEEQLSVSVNGNDFFETQSVTANILQPEFGNTAGESLTATFEPEDDGEITIAASPAFSNTGDGVMVLEDASIVTSPYGIDATVTSVPDEIDSSSYGPETEEVEVSLDIDDVVGEGEETITIRAEDNLGNQDELDITVDIVQPPAVGSTGTTVEFGEMFPGESASTTFTLEERGGYEAIEGVDTYRFGGGSDVDLTFPGLSDLFVPVGGSAEQEAEITIDDTSDRGRTVRDVEFSPLDEEGIETQEPVSFAAEIIYPPYFEDVSVSDTEFVFDEPKDQKQEFTREKTVSIQNGGDIPMNIRSMSVSVDGSSDIDATVVDQPSSVPARSSETATIQISASTDTPEGQWDLDIDTVANEPATLSGETTGEISTEASVSVDHRAELDIEDSELDTGTVIITNQESLSTDLTERLGYQDIESFSFQKVAGPDAGWLTVEEQPSELSAGETQPFRLSVEFDTSAEVFRTYTWEFEVDGENVEQQQITVVSTPEPFDFSDTINDLNTLTDQSTGDMESITSEMATALETLETDLQSQNSTTTREDIPTVITAASSATILVESTSEADSLIEEGDHEAAQTELVRATAAFNTLSLANEEVSSDELRSRVSTSRDAASQVLTDLFDRQEQHFQSRLEQEDTTVLEEAQITRELSRLAELSGEDGQADELQNRSENAFREYSELVTDANEDLIAAREQRDELDENLFVSPLGQRVFFIGSYSTYDSETKEILGLYGSASEAFEEAGATERAETANNEQNRMANAYDTAFLFSAGLGGVFGIGLLFLILWEIRALYRYRIDTEQAVSGDFLLPWAETE